MNVFKQLRQEHRFTQEHLSYLLHVDQTTVSKWETDKALPEPNMLIKLSELYDCSIDYLLGRSDIRHPNGLHPPSITYSKLVLTRNLSDEPAPPFKVKAVEAEVIEKYRLLSERSQSTLRQLLDLMVENEPQGPKQVKPPKDKKN